MVKKTLHPGFFSVLPSCFVRESLPLQRRNKSEYNVSPWPERRAAQKLTTMKTDNKTPMRDLEYQIKRYQTMGNGAACQQLRNEMQRRQGAEA